MRLPLLAVCLCFITAGLSAQTVADFENIGLAIDTFANGSDGSGGFSSGNVFLPNTFEDFGNFTSWSGWALSTMTDTLTPGFGNQYSAITGHGADGSATYAVSFGESRVRLTGVAEGGFVDGLFITNSTYTYLSLLNGDSFSKKFGGETGDDPDFFLLTIKGYLNGELLADSVDFYLADYRFEDKAEDYILDEWAFVDLSSLGPVDSLAFTLSSSDVGNFGMNTPAYFCADNILTRDGLVSTRRPELGPPLRIYPNPATDWLRLDWRESTEGLLLLFDPQGRVAGQRVLRPGANTIDLRSLPAGTYVASILFEGKRRSSQVVVY